MLSPKNPQNNNDNPTRSQPQVKINHQKVEIFFGVNLEKASDKNNQRDISRLKVKPPPRLNHPTL